MASSMKNSPLWPPLREFEVSVIVKFVPASTKLTVLALLNKSWSALLSKNYAWSYFPKRPP